MLLAARGGSHSFCLNSSSLAELARIYCGTAGVFSTAEFRTFEWSLLAEFKTAGVFSMVARTLVGGSAAAEPPPRISSCPPAGGHFFLPPSKNFALNLKGIVIK